MLINFDFILTPVGLMSVVLFLIVSIILISFLLSQLIPDRFLDKMKKHLSLMGVTNSMIALGLVGIQFALIAISVYNGGMVAYDATKYGEHIIELFVLVIVYIIVLFITTIQISVWWRGDNNAIHN
jgi:hypothetical protein